MNIHNYAEMIKAFKPMVTDVIPQGDNYYQIETPFLDTHNEMIYFYIEKKEGKVRSSSGIFLSDDNETINNYHSGYDYSLLIQKFCDKVLYLPYVSFDGQRIVSEHIYEKNFPQVLISFIQAMILCSNIEYKELC